jgi:hypothetical protein
MTTNDDDALWSDDDDDKDDDDGKGKQNNLQAQLRKLRKELKARDEELEPLRQFKSEYEQKSRIETLGETFKELKLPPKLARAYLAENASDEEVTPAKVIEWAKELGFELQPEEGQPSPAAEPAKGPAFVAGTSSQGATTGPKLTLAEWQQIEAKEGPAAARAAWDRVEKVPTR